MPDSPDDKSVRRQLDSISDKEFDAVEIPPPFGDEVAGDVIDSGAVEKQQQEQSQAVQQTGLEGLSDRQIWERISVDTKLLRESLNAIASVITSNL